MPQVVAAASYYQETMAPAVMLACGRGLVSPANPPVPSLDDFLSRRADTFDCRLAPQPDHTRRLTALQSASRYLLAGVGLAWKISGVSWSGLWWMFGLLYAVTSVMVYCAARCLLGRPMSVVVALACMTSTLQLATLPHLRDYSKAPFFAAMLLAVLAVLTRPLSARALLAWSAAAGAAMGVAVGVRFDITVLLGIYGAAVLFAAPGRFADHWRVRVAAVAVSGAAFVLAGLPVLRSFELGNNSWHVIILGLAEPHQAALDLHPTPYQLGTLYNDSFVAAVVNSAWQRTHGTNELLLLDSPGYGAAAGEYFRAIALQFPADLVVRAWAAVIKMFRLPFEGSLALPPFIPLDAVIGRVFASRAAALAWVNQLAPWIAALPMLALLLLARVNLRAALLGVAACVFLGGLSSMQFQGRHVFHLESLIVLLFVFALSGAVTLVRQRRFDAARTQSWWATGVLATLLIVLMVGPAWALRAHQQEAVRELFARYDAAWVSEPMTRTAVATTTLLTLPAFMTPLAATLSSHFVGADFGGAACDYDEVSGMIRYRAERAAADFSRPFTVRVAPDGSLTRMWFAVYELGDTVADRRYRFAGLEVPTPRASCVAAMGRLSGVDNVPLLIDVTRDERWEETPLYARLRPFESGDDWPSTYVWPADASFTRSELARPVSAPGAIDFQARSVTVTDHGEVRMRGIESPAAYLLSWKVQTVDSGALLIAEGVLQSGGVVLGLERDGRWAVQMPVTTRGPFRVAIRVAETGSYRAVIANNRAGGGLWTSLVLSRVGWAK